MLVLLLGSASCIGGDGGAVDTPGPALPATAGALANDGSHPVAPAPIQQLTLPTAPTPEPLRAAKDAFGIIWGTIEPYLPHLVYARPPEAPEDRAVDSTALQRNPDEPALPIPLGWVGGTCGGIAPDASGRFFLYTHVTEGEPLTSAPVRPYSWDPERTFIPAIGLLDAEGGEDHPFAEPACGPAWSSDGRIAYVQPLAPETSAPWHYPVGRLEVRPSLAAGAEPWTEEPQAFGELVWAGEHLIAQRGRPHSDYPILEDLVVFDAPNTMRTLAPGGRLVALSPDGTRALVTTPGDRSDGYRYEALIVQVEDGAVLASMVLPRWELANLATGGSWDGDRVLTTVGRTADATSPPGPTIVILDVGEDTLEIERVISLLGREIGGLGIYDSIYGTQLIGDSDRLGFWVARPTVGTFYGECNLHTHSCLLSQDPNGRGFVESNSRPWPGR
jgi:hypothetical protein